VRNALTDPRVAQGQPPFDHPVLYAASGRAAQPYGVGSPGSNGRTPRVLTPDPPVLGNPQLRVAIDDGLPGAPALLLHDTVAGASTLLGIHINVGFGASFLAFPLGALRAGTDGIGWTSFAARLPSDPALAGAPIFLQVIAGDPGTAAGLSSSAGLRVTLFAGR
jgi:hypothetical protein